MSNENPVMSPVYDRMLSMMNTYSSILQGYRSIFATVETILAAMVIFAVSLSAPFRVGVLFILAFAGIRLSKLWRSACKVRAHDERYFQWQLMKIEKKESLSGEVIGGLQEWRDLCDEQKLHRLYRDSIVWPKGEGENENQRRERIDRWLNLGHPDARWYMDVRIPQQLIRFWFALPIIFFIIDGVALYCPCAASHPQTHKGCVDILHQLLSLVI